MEQLNNVKLLQHIRNISVFLSGRLTAILKKVKRFQQDIKKT